MADAGGGLATGAAALLALLRQTLSTEAPRRWTVAFSGGVDSTALLLVARHAARELGAHLTALHVHHGLHSDADAWAAHCRAVAEALDVPLAIVRVQVTPAGRGIEDAARQARYDALAAADTDLLLLAHHRDDQVETVLLNLLRGAGAHGAAGIPAMRRLPRRGGGRVPLLRPLLDFDRADLRRWVTAAGLHWIDDPSNEAPAFSRGVLRTAVLPALRARFPVNEALAHAACRFREAAQLLDERAEDDLAACAADGSLALAPFAGLSPARQRNALYRLLTRVGVRIAGASRLEEVRRQFVAATADARTCVPLGDGHQAMVWRQRLWIVPASAPTPAQSLTWAGEASLRWGGGELQFPRGDGRGLSLARVLAAGAMLRSRTGSERLRLAAARPRQRLKTLWQTAGVPPWVRDVQPLLWAGETLVWVPGFPVDPTFGAAPDEVGFEPFWRAADAAEID